MKLLPMKIITMVSAQEKDPGKETRPVLPPEHPVIKPGVSPEKERSNPFHPVPEIQPARQPEIKPGKTG